MKKIRPLVTVVLLLTFLTSFGQEAPSASNEIEFKRLFVPSIQFGSISHQSRELSKSFVFQTSIELRTKPGIFFRLNFDEYASNFNLNSATNKPNVIEGRVSFTEFSGGFGYRLGRKKHKVFGLVQAGTRLYNYPTLLEYENRLEIKLDSRNVAVSKYIVGYEYYLSANNFLSVELFSSNSLTKKDFWTNKSFLYGITIGFSAALTKN